MASTEISLLWATALEEYGKETERGVDQLNPAIIGDISSVEDLAAKIESRGAAFQSWRTRHSRLFGVLKGFVNPVSQLLKISITPVSTVDFGAPCSAVLGSLLYLIKACEGVSDAYDWVEQVSRELQEFSERLSVYAEAHIDDVLKNKIIAILAFVLKINARSERLIRDRRFREYLRVTFLGKDVKTKELLEDLNQLFDSEQRFVAALTYASTQRTERKASQIWERAQQTSKEVKSVLRTVAQREARDAKDDIKEILHVTSANIDVEETFARNRRALIPGTASWLQQEPLFNSWIDKKASTLWIFGGAGAGKTFLSTWIVKTLLEEDPQTRGPIAYFFVKEHREVLRDANVILKTLAAQILEQDQSFYEHATRVCSRVSRTLTAEDTWEHMFLEYYTDESAKSEKAATIVIDGLDEATAETRTTILKFVQSLPGLRGGLHFAIVGRGSLRGDLAVAERRIQCIQVSRFKNWQDIDKYVRKRLAEVEVLQVMSRVKPNGLKRANQSGAIIRIKVLEGAGGVFLWAKLLLDSIVKKDLTQIESILVNPPQTLDDMIWSVLDRLARDDDLDHTILRKMLLVMTFSYRPLLFGELDLILSLPAQKPNFLLWGHTQGKMSSVFDLKYPARFDPDAVNHANDNDTDARENPSVREDVAAFDFTGEDHGSGVHDEGEASSLFGTVLEGFGKVNISETPVDGAASARLLSEGQLKTQVAFYHSHIRDFTFREGSPHTRKNPELPIIPNSVTAHADMAIICLQMFRARAHSQNGHRYLAEYPLTYLERHLRAVDRESTSLGLRIEIIEGLYRLFGTSQGSEAFITSVGRVSAVDYSYDTLWHQWVATDRNLKLVQRWFGDVDDLCQTASWDESMLRYLKSAANDMRSLLRPLMISASSLWLVRSGYNSPVCTSKGEWPCWLLYGWHTLVETATVKRPTKSWQWTVDWSRFEVYMDHTRIIELAGWAGLPKDTFWYCYTGAILYHGNYYAQAIEHLSKAIDLNDGAWVAMQGIALCHGNQGQYFEAISWMEKAITSLPSNMTHESSSLWSKIAHWREQVDDVEGAYTAVLAAHDTTPSIDAQLLLIHHLSLRKDYGAVIEKLRGMDNTPGANGATLLVNTLLNHRRVLRGVMIQGIGAACRHEKLPPFIVGAIDRAFELLRESLNEPRLWDRRIDFPDSSANFLLDYYGMKLKAEELLRYSLDFIDKVGYDEKGHFRQWRVAVTSRLAQLYYDCLIAPPETTDQSRISDAESKLEHLATVEYAKLGSEHGDLEMFWADWPTMLWGRWLRYYRNVEEPLWKSFFRGLIMNQLDKLNDKNPAVFTDALLYLGATLRFAGDNANGMAISAILISSTAADRKRINQATSELQQTQVGADGEVDVSQEVLETDSNPGDHVFLDIRPPHRHYPCEGCSKDVMEVEKMYLCEICAFVQWCDKCLPILQEGDGVDGVYKLPKSTCSRYHKFNLMWPVAEEDKHVAAASYRQGVKLRKEWLEKLKSEWSMEK